MPYTGASDSSLPDYVKKLSAKDKRQWVAVFNSAYKKCTDDDGDSKECETSAFAQANGVVKKGRIVELWENIKRLFEPHLQELPEPERTEYLPTQTRSFVITRQADGKARWLMIAASATINKANSIDSTMLFDNFIKHAKETGEYPALDFLHQEDAIRFGAADWLARDGALYLASGTFDETDIAQAAAAGLESQPDYWGASISYRITEPPMLLVAEGQIPIYTNGVNRYISIVPKRMAANLFTAVSVTEEVMRMNKSDFEELVRLVGPEKAAQFAADVDDSNRTITEVGMVTRTDEPPAPVEAVTATDTAANPAPVVEAATGPERVEVVPMPEPVEEMPMPTMADVMAKVAELAAEVAELKAAYGMVQEASVRSVEDQKRAVSALDDMAQRLAPIEALSARWQQWLDDAPEYMKEQEHVYRARNLATEPMTLEQIAQQNLAKMNRGPHSRH